MKEGRRQAVATKPHQPRASHPSGSFDLDSSFGGSGSDCESSSSPTKNPLPPYRAQAEDKKFPKCRACNYRYFTRLDLCRHFVDFHLRAKVSNWVAAEGDQCPSCPLRYPKRQSRLRHFIWSHQDLEKLALQEVRVKLSEFMPSTRDLDIVQMKQQQKEAEERGEEFKPEFRDLTDLAMLPVNDEIDVKCAEQSCELCGEEFSASVNKARDKGVHLLSHFRDDILREIPSTRPFKCPRCPYEGRDVIDLCRHYGLSHKVVFALMRRELGPDWSLEESASFDCVICHKAMQNARSLNDHYCCSHFYTQLAQGLPTEPPFQCPDKCQFVGKTQLALIRHVGTKHKKIKALLEEMGHGGARLPRR